MGELGCQIPLHDYIQAYSAEVTSIPRFITRRRVVMSTYRSQLYYLGTVSHFGQTRDSNPPVQLSGDPIETRLGPTHAKRRSLLMLAGPTSLSSHFHVLE